MVILGSMSIVVLILKYQIFILEPKIMIGIDLSFFACQDFCYLVGKSFLPHMIPALLFGYQVLIHFDFLHIRITLKLPPC